MTQPGLLTRKQGMLHLYNDEGAQVPVTVLSVDAVTVVGHRTVARDGYSALIVGAGSAGHVHRAQRPFYAKNNLPAKAKNVEFRMPEDACPALGTQLLPSQFTAGDRINVRAVSIGKGFAGVMKRHNFKGMRASHGVSLSHRAHGSTGQRQDPGKVFKGKKMAGHLGARYVTTRNLKVFRVDDSRGLLLVKGAVPGPKGGWVTVKATYKGS